MGAIVENNKFIDVICQHTSKGEIIPMRIRVLDEDGMYQTYNIKSYKEISHPGTYNSPYGTLVHNNNWLFSCTIQVFEQNKTLTLFYNTSDNLWKLC